MKTIKFIYKNHKAEVRERTVDFIGVMYDHTPPFGYQPGWFLQGYCHEKQDVRSFAFSNLILDLNQRFNWIVS